MCLAEGQRYVLLAKVYPLYLNIMREESNSAVGFANPLPK